MQKSWWAHVLGKVGRVFVPLGILLLAAAAALAGPIDDIVNQVSQASYTAYLTAPDTPGLLYTHTGDNRFWGPQHDLARDNIRATLAGFGLTASIETYIYSGMTVYDVVGEKLGTDPTKGIYIVGAHYDSWPGPGADDDASGVAGVLEAARVLSQYQFQSTLRFIAFDREEYGLYGSWAYAAAHAGENIRGMIELDMIAYNPPQVPNSAKIYGLGTEGSPDPIQAALKASLAAYAPSITTTILPNPYACSDHYPFEAYGKPACLLIEGSVFTSYEIPTIHTVNDSVELDGLDYAYATSLERGAVGYLAEHAGLASTTAIPEPNCFILFVALVVGKLARRRRSSGPR